MNTSGFKLTAAAVVCTLASALLASNAQAQTYTVKIGGAYIDPRASSSALQGTLPTGVPALPLIAVQPGNVLEVQPKATVLFSISRSFNDNWDAELVLGVPPEHDVKLRVGEGTKAIASAPAGTLPALVNKGVAQHVASDDGKVVATVKQVAPTLFLNYKFGDASSALRPYVGIGVNYTQFSATSTEVGNALYNDGPVRISLTNSVGLAFQMGLGYKLDKNWSVNAGWATASVKNDIKIRTNTSEQTASYRFHPSVFSVTAGYQF